MDNNCLVTSVDQEMQTLFNMIDKNNDGFITEKEIKTMLKDLGEKVRKKDIRKMIKEADQNKDGKISFNGTILLPFSHIISTLEIESFIPITIGWP